MATNLYLFEVYISNIVIPETIKVVPVREQITIMVEVSDVFKLVLSPNDIELGPYLAPSDKDIRNVHMDIGQSIFFPGQTKDIENLTAKPIVYKLAVGKEQRGTGFWEWSPECKRLAEGSSYDKPAVCKHDVTIKDSSNNTAAIVKVLVRLSSFGAKLQSPFETVLERGGNKRVLIKTNNTTFQCQPLGQGSVSDFIPISSLYENLQIGQPSWIELFNSGNNMDTKGSTYMPFDHLRDPNALSVSVADMASMVQKPHELKFYQLPPVVSNAFVPKTMSTTSKFPKMTDEDLTKENIEKILCKCKDCPAVRKFGDYGIGPCARGPSIGGIYGRPETDISYGMSQSYGTMDNYGPYGILVSSEPKKSDEPFITKSKKCSCCRCRDNLRLKGGGIIQEQDPENDLESFLREPLRLKGGGIFDTERSMGKVLRSTYEVQQLYKTIHDIEEMLQNFRIVHLNNSLKLKSKQEMASNSLVKDAETLVTTINQALTFNDRLLKKLEPSLQIQEVLTYFLASVGYRRSFEVPVVKSYKNKFEELVKNIEHLIKNYVHTNDKSDGNINAQTEPLRLKGGSLDQDIPRYRQNFPKPLQALQLVGPNNELQPLRLRGGSFDKVVETPRPKILRKTSSLFSKTLVKELIETNGLPRTPEVDQLRRVLEKHIDVGIAKTGNERNTSTRQNRMKFEGLINEVDQLIINYARFHRIGSPISRGDTCSNSSEAGSSTTTAYPTSKDTSAMCCPYQSAQFTESNLLNKHLSDQGVYYGLKSQRTPDIYTCHSRHSQSSVTLTEADEEGSEVPLESEEDTIRSSCDISSVDHNLKDQHTSELQDTSDVQIDETNYCDACYLIKRGGPPLRLTGGTSDHCQFYAREDTFDYDFNKIPDFCPCLTDEDDYYPKVQPIEVPSEILNAPIQNITVNVDTDSRFKIKQKRPPPIPKASSKKFRKNLAALIPKERTGGNKVGHQNCVCKPVRVPKGKGWLWDTWVPCVGLKPRTDGWKPGAVPRRIAFRIRQYHYEREGLDPAEMRRRKKQQKPKHTIVVQKREGDYLITVNPLKDPKTIKNPGESPYLDCTPMKFKIAKDDRGPPSSCVSEFDLEFSPPAAIVRPEFFRKVKKMIDFDGQCNPKEIEAEVKKLSAETKSVKGKKGKAGKGGKGRKLTSAADFAGKKK